MAEGLTGNRSSEGWRKTRGKKQGTPKMMGKLHPLEYVDSDDDRMEVGSESGGN